MDLRIFDSLAKCEYKESDPWELEDYLYVFHYYFRIYEQRFGRPHPHIKREQIRNIMDSMPYINCESRCGTEEDLSPEDYGPLIDRYFDMDWEGSDYNINHFFSGQIREMRFYEVLY